MAPSSCALMIETCADAILRAHRGVGMSIVFVRFIKQTVRRECFFWESSDRGTRSGWNADFCCHGFGGFMTDIVRGRNGASKAPSLGVMLQTRERRLTVVRCSPWLCHLSGTYLLGQIGQSSVNVELQA